ncbi:Mfs1.2 [Earliella scabrosa]|nr:Mfs1.2 [Earliella scabrosa]
MNMSTKTEILNDTAGMKDASASILPVVDTPMDDKPLSTDGEVNTSRSTRKGGRFWVVLFSLLLSTFFATLEAYAVSTALPVIVSDLHADEFVWVASAYGIASTALLPLSGGLAEVFGRRPVMLGCVALFALGGALAGAAQSMNMLIAARVVQGAGAGGMLTISQIILSDLVTLQERGMYNGLFGLMWALGGCVGPLIGGALARPTTWRWIFYMNIPASGIIAVFMIAFLRLNKPPTLTLVQAFRRLDSIGNTLLVGSTCAVVIGLTWGGVVFLWNSAQVLVPLCVGVGGLCAFLIYEWRFCEYPVVPLQLLSNRTSLSGYLQIALSAFVNITFLYYLPVYYQACLDASPTASAVDLFGFVFTTGPFAMITGATIAATKRYRPQLWLAWALMLIGLGLTSTMSESTSRAASIGYQIPTGIAIGMTYSATYFPVLAPLPLESSAPALSFFVFVRTFAQIWGVSVGGAILQNGLQSRLPQSIQQSIPGLRNIAYAVVPLVPGMPQPDKDITRRAFADSLQTVWRVLIGIAGAGLISSVFMKGLPLHTQKDETWAMKEKEEDAPSRE